MVTARLDEMVRGWFVGNFSPTAFATPACVNLCLHDDGFGRQFFSRLISLFR